MQKTPYAASALFLLAVLAACSEPPTAPSAPPATSQPSPPTPVLSGPGQSAIGPGQGTMTIREFSPGPGARLTVRDCPSGTTMQRCTDQWRGAVEVLVDREMTYAVLVVRFFDGDRLCGVSASTSDVVRPGIRETFNLSLIWLSGDIAGDILRNNPCQLPTRTTRMEVELWSDSSTWTNTLKVGLPWDYTFVSQ